MATTGLLAPNSPTVQAAVMPTINTVSTGEYSSHSPGRSRCGRAGAWTAVSTPSCSAVTARAPEGVDSRQIRTETTISTAAMAIDCHRKMVWLNGSTPVMASTGLGRLAGLACSCAAEEVRPIAQVAPRPR